MPSEISGNGTLAPEILRRAWHPKLTPYRLIVLSTTVGLGTAKAVAADHLASITLEWISGVLVFLILQSVSLYDGSETTAPLLIAWMFTIDCMDFVWKFLAIFSIPRPKYRSDEMTDVVDEVFSTHPPVTPYRLLVCTTVVCFGMTKGVLAYVGYSRVTNWIDWSLGVLLTTILYCIGLYEGNPVNMWHDFFHADYTSSVNSAGRNSINSIAVITTVAWISVWIFVLLDVTWVQWNWSGKRTQPDGSNLYLSKLIDKITDNAFKVLLTTISLDAIILGSVVLFAYLYSFRETIAVSTAVRAVFRRRNSSWQIALRVFIHVALHLSGISGCVATAVLWLRLGFPKIELDDSTLVFSLQLFTLSCALIIAGAVLTVAWKIGRHMVVPWIIYRNPGPAGGNWERSLLSL